MPVPAASYNPNIPQATDQLSNSQGQILNNFGAIMTLIDQDHVDFAAAGAGKHNQITFPTGAPADTIAPPDIGFYPKTYPVSGLYEIFISNINNAQIPFTSTGSGISTTAATGRTGITINWMWLPSGYLLKWGVSTTLFAGTPNPALTFSVSDTGITIPEFTAPPTWGIAVFNGALTTPSTNLINYTGVGTTAQVIAVPYSVTTNFVNFSFIVLGKGV